MEGHSRELDQLIYLLNSMFSKQSLRKNVYLFNALTPQLTLPLRAIAKERRVANLTQDLSFLTAVHKFIEQAIKQCPQLQLVSGNQVRVLVQGEQLVVRLWTTVGRVSRKEVSTLTRQMRCHYRQEKDYYLLEFQSHAAAIEFVQRAKGQNKEYQCQVLEKDPYKCLQEAINNYRKQKKAEKVATQKEYYNPQLYYLQEYYSHMVKNYPLFVRRAVESDTEELQQKGYHPKTTKGKQEQDLRLLQPDRKECPFSAENFPTLEESLPGKK